MRVAQDLYEGIEIGDEGGGRPHHVHANRLDARGGERGDSGARLHAHACSARSIVAGRGAALRRLRKAKNTQDAHEAIRPTDPTRRPDAVKRYLTPDQFKLYSSIWQRFMASQMTPAVFDTTTVDFDIPSETDRSRQHRPAQLSVPRHRLDREVPGLPGALSRRRARRASTETLEDEQALPVVEVGEKVPCKSITPSQHFTEPPPRFSEASLVKELERLGIGRPSTYASIISVLADRRYVELDAAPLLPDGARRERREGDGQAVPRHLQRGLHVGDGTGARQGRGGRPRLAEGPQGLLLAVRGASEQGRRAVADRRSVRPVDGRTSCAAPNAAASSSRAADSSGRSSPARITRRRASTRVRSRARRPSP